MPLPGASGAKRTVSQPVVHPTARPKRGSATHPSPDARGQPREGRAARGRRRRWPSGRARPALPPALRRRRRGRSLPALRVARARRSARVSLGSFVGSTTSEILPDQVVADGQSLYAEARRDRAARTRSRNMGIARSRGAGTRLAVTPPGRATDQPAEGDRNGPVRSDRRQYRGAHVGRDRRGVRGRARARTRAGREREPAGANVRGGHGAPAGRPASPAPGLAHVLVEPLDRGSAASILFPVHWITRAIPRPPWSCSATTRRGSRPASGIRSPGPPGTRSRSSCSGFLRAWGSPTRGFIVPGERIDSTVEGPLFRVRDLVDPDPDGDVRPCAGALGNGGVFAGRAKAFIGAAAEHGAALNDRLARAATFAGQEHERWALRQAYALAPRVDFFRSVLRPIARALAVLEVEDVGRLADGGEERALGGRASLGFRAWSTATAPAALERESRTADLRARAPPRRRCGPVSPRAAGARAPRRPGRGAPAPSRPSRGTRR